MERAGKRPLHAEIIERRVVDQHDNEIVIRPLSPADMEPVIERVELESRSQRPW